MIQIPGQHVSPIKNRSSKHLFILCKHKPIERCVSYEKLNAWAANGDRNATKELARRNRRMERRGTKPASVKLPSK